VKTRKKQKKAARKIVAHCDTQQRRYEELDKLETDQDRRLRLDGFIRAYGSVAEWIRSQWGLES
jgi:hypothetical protein